MYYVPNITPNYTPKGSASATQKTGGQYSITGALGGIVSDIGAGVREYTRLRISQEIQRAQPGVTYDPLSAPYSNPGDGAQPVSPPISQGNSSANVLVLAALAGAALALV